MNRRVLQSAALVTLQKSSFVQRRLATARVAVPEGAENPEIELDLHPRFTGVPDVARHEKLENF